MSVLENFIATLNAVMWLQVVILLCVILLIIKNVTMKEQIIALAAAVAAEKTVVDSTKVLLSSLTEKLKAAATSADAGDTTALNDLISEVEAQTADLSAAVTANTPAATAEAATPAVEN